MYVENFGIPRGSSSSRAASRNEADHRREVGPHAVGRAGGVVTHRCARGERFGRGGAARPGRRAARGVDRRAVRHGHGASSAGRFRGLAGPRSLTNAGGPGILAADALEASGIQLPDLSTRRWTPLGLPFPPEASIRNPLDMIASATPARYRAAYGPAGRPRCRCRRPDLRSAARRRQDDVADAIAARRRRPDKPVLAVLMGRKDCRKDAPSCTSSASRHTSSRSRRRARSRCCTGTPSGWRAPHAAVGPIAGVDRAGGGVHFENSRRRVPRSAHAARGVRSARGLRNSRCPGRLVSTPDEAEAAGSSTACRSRVKVVSPDIAHKTDVGGVRVESRRRGSARRSTKSPMCRPAGADA